MQLFIQRDALVLIVGLIVEILLVGTGPRGLFPPPSFKKYLNSLGIQVDVLDSVSLSQSPVAPGN